jgi:hypothetical protein
LRFAMHSRAYVRQTMITNFHEHNHERRWVVLDSWSLWSASLKIYGNASS